MISFSFDTIYIYNLIALLLGISYGFISQQHQFCFSGSLKDIILFGHTKRLSSVIMAMISAIVFTSIVSSAYNIDLASTLYYNNSNYLLIILGGILFGAGMMLSDGCSSRHLVKLAQGDKYSLISLVFISIGAFGTFFLYNYFYDSLISSGYIISTNTDDIWQLPFAFIISILLLILFFSLQKNLKNINSTLDGLLIGILISISWFVTTYVANENLVLLKDQSFSFIYPLQKFTEFITTGFSSNLFIYPVFLIIGVIIGSFTSSKINKKYKTTLSCHDSTTKTEVIRDKTLGGLFMGIGGYLTLGCTVGQGLSGLSTLACTSLLAISTIMISAYFTGLYLKDKNKLIACFIFEYDEK
jgi:uncharacterized membrane protein YedE/YeeE